MTFQPPPPPPGNEPPPPPPGQWNPPPSGQGRPAGQGGSGGFDPKSVNPLDWAIMGIGALLLIFGFFDYISLDAGPYSDSIGAWHFSHGTFITWFAMVFGVLGGATVALSTFAPQVKLPVPSRVAGFGLFAASFVLYFIGIFVHPEFIDQNGVSEGHGFSFWFSLILAIIGSVLALMRAQQTNTALPGPFNNLPKIGK